MIKPLYINEKKVKKSIGLEQSFKAIEQSYVLFSQSQTVTPQTIAMPVSQGTFFCFPSYLKGHKIFISKLATFYSENRKKGMPTIQPHIFIYNSQNGKLEAIIEARYFAGVRTALTSAVGVKHCLKRAPKVMGILGSGVQAGSHARVLGALFKSIKEIKIYSPTKKNREKLVKELNKELKGVKVIAVENSGVAIEGADVITCVTDSKKPVFSAEKVKSGACILAVGSMGPKMQEVPDEIMGKSLVVVDSQQQVEDYGEIVSPRRRGHKVKVVGEIGKIIKQKKFNPQKKTIVFKHHGLPVTDAALAESIYLNFKV